MYSELLAENKCGKEGRILKSDFGIRLKEKCPDWQEKSQVENLTALIRKYGFEDECHEKKWEVRPVNFDTSLIKDKQRESRSTILQHKPMEYRNAFRSLLSSNSEKFVNGEDLRYDFHGKWCLLSDLFRELGEDSSKEAEDEFIASLCKGKRDFMFSHKPEDKQLYISLNFSAKDEFFDTIFFPKKSNKDFNKNVGDLKNIALKEKWGDKDSDTSVLEKYLFYTFVAINRRPGHLVVSKDGRYAAFNTGLVTDLYKDIIAYLERNRNEGRQPWTFLKFSTSDKDLNRFFENPKFPRLKYLDYKDLSKVIFDPDIKLEHNDEHIIKDNVGRLHPSWLKEALGEKFFEKPKAMDDKKYSQELINLVEDSSKRSLLYKLQGVIDIAIKRVSWNYKTAVPYYYAQRNEIGWLLPLSDENNKPFVALVVTREQSNSDSGYKYQVQTLYRLPWAYLLARVVNRPDSDWLHPKSIKDNEVEEQNFLSIEYGGEQNPD